MYSHHFAFAEPASAVAPADWSDGADHRRALTVLGYGVAQGEGIMLLTGDAGTGKSAVTARIAATIDLTKTAVIPVVADPHGEDVLRLVGRALGVAVGGRSGIALLEAIEQRLEPTVRSGRRTLFIVREAHGLPGPELDALRILSTLRIHGRTPIQVLLVGRPELRERIKRPELMALRQRVIAEYHFGPASRPELRAEPPVRQRLTLIPQPPRPDDAELEKRLAALKAQLATQEVQLQRALMLLLERAVEEGSALPFLQLPAVSGTSPSYSA